MAEKCPFCGSDDIGIGYQLGHGRIFADEYAFVTSKDCSEGGPAAGVLPRNRAKLYLDRLWAAAL